MKLFHLLITLVGFSLSVCLDINAAPPTRIVVVVNKDALTAADVEERIRLMNIGTGKPATTPVSEEVRKQVIRGMIEELLQLQAAKSKSITIEDKEVEKSFENLAKDNNKSSAEMLRILKDNGISKETMMMRLKAQMAWVQYIRAFYGPLVHISDKEVDLVLAQAKEEKPVELSPDLMEVKICQAVFAVTPEMPEEVMTLLGPKIEETQQAKGCTAFLNAAQGFGAKVDANRVVKMGDLPPALKPMVQKAKVGTCLQPTMTPDGLVLTMVCSKTMPKVTPSLPLTRDTASYAIEQEKLSKRAIQEMVKLKSAAFIEWK